MNTNELYTAVNGAVKKQGYYSPLEEFYKGVYPILKRAIIRKNYKLMDYFLNVYSVPIKYLRVPMLINYSLSVGNIKMAKFIMKTHKHTFGSNDRCSDYGLYQSALAGHLDSVKFILESKGIDEEYVRNAAPIILDHAAYKANRQLADYILDKKFITDEDLVKLEPEFRDFYISTPVSEYLVTVIESTKAKLATYV